jgi:hypothetical protein
MGLAAGCVNDADCDDGNPCTVDQCWDIMGSGVCMILTDPGKEGSTDCTEETFCNDSTDNDGNGLTDCEDEYCIGYPGCPNKLCVECAYPTCDGWCPQPLICVPVATPGADEHCDCQPKETDVPEFCSLGMALMILLTAPGFAYLMIKRRGGAEEYQ